MDGIIAKTVLGTFVGICTILFVLQKVLIGKQDPREPPLAPTSIPYFEHAFGMLRQKHDYPLSIYRKTKSAPILTMLMPGKTLYIVNSLPLIQQVQKQYRALSFFPVAGKMSTLACGAAETTREIVMTNVHGDGGVGSVFADVNPMIREVMAPGATLDAMNKDMMATIGRALDEVTKGARGKTPMKLSLKSWIKDCVTQATTNAIYGPENPFKKKSIKEAFWEFEDNFLSVIIGLFPSLLARKGLAARERVAHSFKTYLQNDNHMKGSPLIQGRHRINAQYGIPILDIARFEVAMCIALLVNTNPSMFWLLFFIYSNPALLNDIRAELDPTLETSKNVDGSLTRLLDLTKVKSKCPLLASAFQETLRHRGMISSVRQVMEDTILDGKYLLKKDALVQMPARVVHMDAAIWGPDVEEFNPHRFLRSSNMKKASASGFRAFGGGTMLCPGRHFATTEILAMVAMCVVRFELKPVTGKWTMPTTRNTGVAAAVMEPDQEVEVEVSLRKGFEEGTWRFGLSESKEVFAFVDEDQ
ncbi:Cytochrome P450 [Glarea lozoyensis ATCC 20868]|uniref:Cytochrome P450 n=1 Tax=Glarea lozoyensis (strain ATCC 20868 / MF5171) TaxID=1116229 RepID=S3CYL5_GLAL2|nr:Cytochrome P450 [Glarea lozoyensis ATCC 20868]EPE24916.1 Cytochrome P450 [Glarea lozoyensis ATCC 20868]